jgi:large subunit ribosomal protein L21
MYAVIKTGGKQYRVAQNEVLKIERLAVEAGRRIAFNEVLAVDAGAGLKVGTPMVAGAMVTATVVEQTHAPTILVFKKKRRHNYRRKNGHRQDLTVIRIGEILTDGRQPSPEPEPQAEAAPRPAAAKPKAKAKPAQPPAAKKAAAKPKPAKKAAAKPAAKAKAKPAAGAAKAKAPAKKAPAKKPKAKE